MVHENSRMRNYLGTCSREGCVSNSDGLENMGVKLKYLENGAAGPKKVRWGPTGSNETGPENLNEIVFRSTKKRWGPMGPIL